MSVNLSICLRRRALFRASTVMLHEKGPGERAFRGQFRIHKSHPSKPSDCGGDSSQDDATLCGASIFIEPVEWMKHDILSPNGKVNYLRRGISFSSTGTGICQCQWPILNLKILQALLRI